jgi:hypothetical protein
MRRVPVTLPCILLILTTLTGCATDRFIRQDIAEIEVRNEVTPESVETFNSTQSVGFEAEYKRAWINALSGPMDEVAEPCMGYGVGMFGGYTTMGDGVLFDNGRLRINDVIRSGISFSFHTSNSADFSQESLASEFALKWGVALSEREEREAIDVIGITRQGYWFISPSMTVRTPLRFHIAGFSTVLVAGAEVGYYRAGDDGFNTIGVNLGFQFLDR